jgi:hypothetical protein
VTRLELSRGNEAMAVESFQVGGLKEIVSGDCFAPDCLRPSLCQVVAKREDE